MSTTTATTDLDVPADARTRAMLAHLSAFVAFFGIPSLVGPLVFWLVWRDDPYVSDQAKEALNFNISFLIYAVASIVLVVVLVGLLLVPLVLIAWFVLVIVAATRASDGEAYRYPMTIRFVV